jgi:hypothetical protein
LTNLSIYGICCGWDLSTTLSVYGICCGCHAQQIFVDEKILA